MFLHPEPIHRPDLGFNGHPTSRAGPQGQTRRTSGCCSRVSLPDQYPPPLSYFCPAPQIDPILIFVVIYEFSHPRENPPLMLQKLYKNLLSPKRNFSSSPKPIFPKNPPKKKKTQKMTFSIQMDSCKIFFRQKALFSSKCYFSPFCSKNPVSQLLLSLNICRRRKYSLHTESC